MTQDYEKMSAFEQIKAGLEDALANVRGELTLHSTTLPSPPPPASRTKIVALRKKLKMSQSVFAAALNVSTKLVQSWEQGVRRPDRGELRLIEMLSRQPDLVTHLILASEPVEWSAKKVRPRKPAARKGRASAA
jgi:putative transcriptional regulator